MASSSKMKMTVEAEVAKAQAELQRINKSIKDIKASQESANKTFSNFLSAGKVIVGAKLIIDAIKKINAEVQKMVDIYRVNETAQARLEGVLYATGNATDSNTRALAKMSEELQKNTLLQGSQIAETQALLLSFSNLGGVFEETLVAAADMSATLGTDLTSSAQTLGRALEDPIQGMSVLRRSNIILSQEKKALITQLQTEGNLYEAQKMLLDEINSRYGGMAEKINGLNTSPIERINTALGNIGSDVGEMLISAFGPALDWMVRNVEKVASWVSRLTAKFTGDLSKMSEDQILKQIEADKATRENFYANLAKQEAGNINKYVTTTNTELIEGTKRQIDQLTAQIDEYTAELERRELLINGLQLIPAPDMDEFEGLSSTVLNTIDDEMSMYEKLMDLIKGTNTEKLHSLELSNKQANQELNNINQMIDKHSDLEGHIKETQKAYSKAKTPEEKEALNELLNLLIAEKEEYREIVENSDLLIEGLEQKIQLNNEAIKSLTAEEEIVKETVDFYSGIFDLIKGTNTEREHSLKLSNKQAETELLNIEHMISAYEKLEDGIIEIQNLQATASTDEERENYQKTLDALEAEKQSYEEVVENSDLLIEGLKQRILLNNEELELLNKERTALDDATDFLNQNLKLISEELDYKQASLQAEIEKARLMREVEGLTEEQISQLERIEIKLKDELDALSPIIDTQKELKELIEDNVGFITQSTEERIKELETLHAQIVAQSQLNNLTKEQYDQLLKIAQGITAEIESLKEVNSWADKIKEALNLGIDTENFDKWVKNADGALKYLKGVYDNFYTTIMNWSSASFAYKQNLLDREVKTHRDALKKMVEENDKARSKIDEKERDRIQALKEQYDADAISYEEYMAGKLEAETTASNARQILKDEEEEKDREILKAQDKLAKEKFEADKKNQIATAIMNGATAAIRAFADLGPIFGSIAAATIAGLTAAQIASINKQKYIPALKEGGVALKPTLAEVGDGNEPEIVLPLSKAKDFGFGRQQQPSQNIIVNLNNATIYGIDDFGKKAYDAIKSAQRVGKVPKMAF